MAERGSLQGEPPYWFKLDNAAKIYPAVIGGDFTAVFRITVILADDVVYRHLADAISVVAERFPYFNVTLSSGAFWYFLEGIGSKPRLYSESGEKGIAFPLGSKNEVMYRILVRNNRISVEFVHILTDGGGALEFLKTLLYQYFKNRGIANNLPEGIIDPEGSPAPEETEDSFGKYFDKRIPATENPVMALHLPFSLNSRPRFRTVCAEIDAGQIREKAREYKISITEYLTSVYLYVLQEIFLTQPEKKRNGIIRVQVPVNLRRMFPSNTMRNFSLFVMPEIDLRLGRLTFEEVTNTVHHFLQLETTPKRISRIITRNVGKEKLLIIRILPLFIKRFILYLAYHTYGSGLCTGVLTNMGVIGLPSPLAEAVDSFSVTPPPPNKKIKISCGIVTYNKKMRITFASIASERELESRFFRFLTDSGISVKLLNE
jgi:NRPS condensation-like uncharacterized protein